MITAGVIKRTVPVIFIFFVTKKLKGPYKDYKPRGYNDPSTLKGDDPMHSFIKLNYISMLYALVFLIPAELLLNAYRIQRLTQWSFGTVNTISLILSLAVLLAGSILLYKLTQKTWSGRKIKYWTALIWFPYFILFTQLFALLFPITNRGDMAGPGSGLILLGWLAAYPFYILLLNLFNP